MAKTKLDENGRVQIPLEELKRLGLKTGTEFELKHDDDLLVLKPIRKKKSATKSPRLSALEKKEIEESENEFATGTSKVYNGPSDLLNSLHAERKENKDKAAK